MDGLQAEVDRCTGKIENEILGPIQGYGYKNASLCFRAGSSKYDRQACVEKALYPANQVSEYVQQEFSNLNDRINRCSQTCHDDVVGFASAPSAEQKAKLEECNNACVFKAQAGIPQLMKRIMDNVAPLLPPTSEFTKGTLLAESETPSAVPGLQGGLQGGLSQLPGGLNLPPPGMSSGVGGNLPKLG